MKSILGEFKEFISRGNLVELAVAVVIGTAFAALINSLVKGMEAFSTPCSPSCQLPQRSSSSL